MQILSHESHEKSLKWIAKYCIYYSLNYNCIQILFLRSNSVRKIIFVFTALVNKSTLKLFFILENTNFYFSQNCKIL